MDEVLELLMDLDASDAQLDCPFLFASARAGFAKRASWFSRNTPLCFKRPSTRVVLP